VPIDPFTGRLPDYRMERAGFDLRIQVPADTRDLFDWKIAR
jgi:hypothetical protein